jgi:hypothetical protein
MRIAGIPSATRTLAGATVQLENRGGKAEQSLEPRARFRRAEIARIFGAAERQYGLQRIAAGKPGFGDEAIRALRQRGHNHEHALGIRGCAAGKIAVGIARGFGDSRKNMVQKRAQRRFGLHRQFRRHAMARNTDAQANTWRRWGEASAHGRHLFSTA